MRNHRNWCLAAVLLYVTAVLGVDTLAAMRADWPFPWARLQWFPFADNGPSVLARFDAFKFFFWFLIPFSVCVPRMDWGAWGVLRWKRRDAVLLAVLALAGVGAMAIIPHVPALDAVYKSGASATPEQKMRAALMMLVWDFSWLIGWEFLHRYVLLRQVHAVWPRFGWLLVPLSEGLYHLQKSRIEALGMVALSLVLSQYTLRRRNILLPLLAHLMIEVQLLLFLLLL